MQLPQRPLNSRDNVLECVEVHVLQGHLSWFDTLMHVLMSVRGYAAPMAKDFIVLIMQNNLRYMQISEFKFYICFKCVVMHYRVGNSSNMRNFHFGLVLAAPLGKNVVNNTAKKMF